ncbi:molybdopterin molybdenumtransferase [Nostoc sp. CENA543]|uniref:molybdopterin molybdotransferase MoeA n=1 Tax=Nostoc sp. CENA543 TaxID=1869241 RepID=UPI000CA2C25B|nr:gephyrin-like molybdotransferase Glp [Nostoc sp. CENA543]AUS99306.1 molybdopterin molybdenumtransferase [Nostoc sp. CENA543]
MLSVQDAANIIFNLVKPLNQQQDTEVLDLFAANGRILAAPVTSPLDFPHWDNSAMDGYAVRYADVKNASAEQPVNLEIIAEIPAGQQPQFTLQPGQAARIFTGAVIPDGADTIVMQENTRRENQQVAILTTPQLGEFVRRKASYYQAGTQLLPSGIKLTAAEIAVLAASQCSPVRVYRRLRVAILSTGNELVTVNQPLQPGQIVDSNQYALAALVQQSGAEPILFGIVRDHPEALAETIKQAITQADIVISSGGVSVGDYDYVDKILTSLGAEIPIRAVAIRPGKPLTVATFPNSPTIYFGLPGNPAAVLVTFWRFVQPAMRKLAGLTGGWEAEFVQVRSHDELRSDGKRETYIWGRLYLIDGVYEFYQAGGRHSSGNLINLAQTNALAVLRVGQTLISPGEQVQVLKLFM